jgi:hypothetical protein
MHLLHESFPVAADPEKTVLTGERAEPFSMGGLTPEDKSSKSGKVCAFRLFR